MRAETLRDLLKKGDRVAVSNITGREASRTSVASQAYANNIVGGWALGKGGKRIECPKGDDIPVFADCARMLEHLPADRRPNKFVVYSPPPAVYGEVKEILDAGGRNGAETIFIITENVSIEVSAKIHILAQDFNVDVIGCNTLGLINAHEHVRAGAVGGEEPEEAFQPGSVSIISNSGNMVNTIASYLLAAGFGTSFGVSTGKDMLLLTPTAELLRLAERDENTRLVILYVEPGGLYEREAIDLARRGEITKPIVAYVAGRALEGRDISLGHAGAVVAGGGTSASAKAEAFDEYFGFGPLDTERRYRRSTRRDEALRRGVRVRSLHHIPAAAALIYRVLGLHRDRSFHRRLTLNPWFVNLRDLPRRIPHSLIPDRGKIPEPWGRQFRTLMRSELGSQPTRRSMRNRSHASSNEGSLPRIYGLSVLDLMKERSFSEALIVYWTGSEPARPFEARLVEMCLTAALTNGPGTISAQAAKLSASAGNPPNTAMIATLAAIGEEHGGNGRRAVKFLVRIFRETNMVDPYREDHGLDLSAMAMDYARQFKASKDAAKEVGMDYERIPCLGHPVFNTQPVNYDPRERAVSEHMAAEGIYNIFLDFYHRLAAALHEVGVATRVWAVNVDAVIACVWLGIAWPKLREGSMTRERAADLAFLGFALGRAAGGAGEYLDHRDYGTPMDARIPVSECEALTPPREPAFPQTT
jgi:succinyl-CoA synthetase alpha subunit